MSFPIEPLECGFNKKDFKLGKELLDNYLQKQASQDIKRHLRTVLVMLVENLVIGYYTLSSMSIRRALVPQELQKNCRRHTINFLESY